MELLMERSSRLPFATGQWVSLFMLRTSLSFFLQPLNSGPQPLADCLFHLLLIAVSIERIQSLSRCVEGNMSARELLKTALGWHQLHENAIGAGAWAFF